MWRRLRKLLLPMPLALSPYALRIRSYTLTDDAALKIIQKLVKQGKDSAEIYIGQGRQDLADTELAQVAVMENLLPEGGEWRYHRLVKLPPNLTKNQ